MSGGVLAAGFAHLAAAQAASRGLAFALNLAAARRLGPEAYGLGAVQFHLLTTTVLFLAREGVRRASLRAGATPGRRALVGAAWLCPPAGAAIALALAIVVQRWRGGGGLHADAYARAVAWHGAAAVLELLSEPVQLLAQVDLRFKLRMWAETAATTLKCVVTYALLVRGAAPESVFSAAQVAYAGAVCALYWGFYLGVLGERGLGPPLGLPPGPGAQEKGGGGGARGHAQGVGAGEGGRGAWDPELLRMCAVFSLQSVEKHVLAEGEKLVLAIFQSGYDQGVYGLVSNLGSLVVRIVFQPFEEAAFTAFSHSAQGPAGGSLAGRRRQGELLLPLLKGVALVGLLAGALGPSYSYTVLRLAYGARWAETDAPAVLTLYSFYVVTLALNGLTEAFVHATASKAQLGAINRMLVVFSAVFVAASILFVRLWGTSGVVIAGCVNMSLRIVFSCKLIAQHFEDVPEFRLRAAVPSQRVFLAAAVASAAARASERAVLSRDPPLFLRTGAAHLALGALAAAAFLAAAATAERELLRRAITGLRARRRAARGGGPRPKEA